MAYFLKKTNNKKGLYLQIYESHWDPHRGHTVNKSVKALGYEHELKEKGITDPISHFKSEIDKMNEKRKAKRAKDKVKKITNESPDVYCQVFFDKICSRFSTLSAFACKTLSKFTLPQLYCLT